MRTEKIRGNVFVANLPRGFSDEALAEAFDPYGIVLNAYIARDPVTGETQGHGLVQIAPDKAADKAIEALNATRVGGRRIEARRADPGMGITPPKPRHVPRPARAWQRY